MFWTPTRGHTVSLLGSEISICMTRMDELKCVGTFMSVWGTDDNVSPFVIIGDWFLWCQKWVGCAGCTINQQVCTHVLLKRIQLGAGATYQNEFVLVQGNAPPHTGQTTRDLLENQGVEVIDWPSKSPDMIPIEQLLTILQFMSVTWLILQPWQHSCVWLWSRPGLPWGLFNLGPWHGAAWSACCPCCAWWSYPLLTNPLGCH